jgi:glucokinase
MKYYIGVDIGGTKCAVVLGKNIKGNIKILNKKILMTRMYKDSHDVIGNIFSAMQELLLFSDEGSGGVGSIGISCGGPLDLKNGIIMSPPNLPGWDNVPIIDMFEKKFGIKTKLRNDANACALAEWKFGAARGYRNVIFLTFGTGMGAGLILDGKLYSGTNDMAGEVGHIRLTEHGPVGHGKAGSFEGYCSGGGIVQIAWTMVSERIQSGVKSTLTEKGGIITAKSIADDADSGDILAKEIYKESGKYLGMGLSILIDILNPEIIVLGSIFGKSQKLLWPCANEVAERESLMLSRKVCRIVPAMLGEELGDVAALATAIYGGRS